MTELLFELGDAETLRILAVHVLAVNSAFEGVSHIFLAILCICRLVLCASAHSSPLSVLFEVALPAQPLHGRHGPRGDNVLQGPPTARA